MSLGGVDRVGQGRLWWVFDFSKFYLQKTNQVSTKVIKLSLSSKPIPSRVYRIEQ